MSDASVLENASLVWLEEPILIQSCLEEALFEVFYGDIVKGNAIPSIQLIDFICIEPLDLTCISSLLLPTTTYHLHAFHESLDDVRGCHIVLA